MFHHSQKKLPVFLFIFFAFLTPSYAQNQVDSDSLFKEARTVAFSGEYEASRRLCRRALKLNPEHSDAALLIGKSYSWEGKYDSARLVLQNIVDKHPSSEAYSAMAKVELWSKNFDEALDYVNKGLVSDAKNPVLLLTKARVLLGQNKQDKALDILQNLLLDTDNEAAAKLLGQVKSAQKENKLMASYHISTFRHHYSTRQLLRLEYMRITAPAKYLSRISYAEQNGVKSLGAQLETYVVLNPKAYVFLSTGISDGNLFATYRGGAEFFHTMPYKMEGSLGVRTLFFTEETVVLYTGQIGKYFKNNWISARTFFQMKNDTWQGTGILKFRHYLNSEAYISLVLSKGSIPSIQVGIDEIYRLNASRVGIEGQFMVNERYILGGVLSYEREEYLTETYHNRLTMGIRIKSKF